MSWRWALLLWVNTSISVFSVVPIKTKGQHKTGLPLTLHWEAFMVLQPTDIYWLTELVKCDETALHVCLIILISITLNLPMPSMAFLSADTSSSALKFALSFTVPFVLDWETQKQKHTHNNESTSYFAALIKQLHTFMYRTLTEQTHIDIYRQIKCYILKIQRNIWNEYTYFWQFMPTSIFILL